MKEEKKRIDIVLVERGLVESRERGKNLISAGLVFLNEEKVGRVSELVSEKDEIRIKGKNMPYVSRGGLKLEKAMSAFEILLDELVCADIGAATGGFTDCMLQNGAKRVYAIDVGYGQLAWKLRSDERVINLERTNIRHIGVTEVPEQVSFISIDVSFISLTLVLPVAYTLLSEGGSLVCLIKPQFEAGKGRVGKKGVVREPEIHREVIAKILSFARTLGFVDKGLTFSPIKGPEGNIEYLLYLSKNSEEISVVSEVSISEIVEASHTVL